MPSLQERFKTSRVGQWALAYIGGAWLTLQIVDILGDQFQWPLRLQQSITVVLIIGFFVTAVLAWYHGEKGQQRFTAVELLIIGALLLIGAGTLSVLRSPDDSTSGPPGVWPGQNTIPPDVLAVLPFENLNGDRADDPLANGIHEDILTQLSGIRDLTVISRRSVLQYADSRKNIRQIAAELGARSVVEGSVQREGERLRVTVQLIDAATDRHVWARTYDLAMDDIFQIQTDVAKQVASALRATLTASEARRIERPPTVGLGAWELLQRARAVVWYAGDTRKNALEEERLLREALAVDPEFALAWAQLSTNFAARPWNVGMQAFWADSALTAARRAIELDPELGLGFFAMGEAYNTQGFLDGAVENYARAIELDPNLAVAYRELGRLASVRGRFDEALVQLRQALLREPSRQAIRSELGHAYAALGDGQTSERWFQAELELREEAVPTHDIQAWAHWWAGRLDEAVAAEARAVAGDPEGPIFRVGLAELSLMNGDSERSVRELREAMQRASRAENLAYLFFATTTLGIAYDRLGDPAAARPFLEESRAKLMAQVEQGVQWPLTHLELAAVDDALGERENALRWAQRAFEFGSRHVHLIELHPGFDGLREEPGFRQILSDMRVDVDRMWAGVEREERTAGLR